MIMLVCGMMVIGGLVLLVLFVGIVLLVLCQVVVLVWLVLWIVECFVEGYLFECMLVCGEDDMVRLVVLFNDMVESLF